MVFITNLIYINPGQEEVFDEFEKIAIPIMSKYNGKMLARIRPAENSFIEYSIERPYEVHLGEFDSEEDFNAFLGDEERKKFLHMKEQAIRSTVLVTGKRAGS
jgi:uncharacterized protein (DUF1330 family)